MAFAAGTIWHNWSTGATGNGGGFDPTNANFPTDLTTDANTGNTTAPVVSSVSYNFVAGDVGAWVFIQSGTNWTPGWYQIASVASNKATLTAGIGTAVLYGTVATGINYQRPSGLTTAAGVATVGTPTAGVWGIDYSQQTGSEISYTDMIIDATVNTIFTSVLNPVGKNIIGNIINVTSGTGFTVQRVQVVSTSGTQGTVDKPLGTITSVGGNGTLGGAIGSSSALTALTQALVAGNKVFIKATGTYTLTATTTATVAAKGDTTNGRISVEGFTTYPGQLDGRPLITSATNSVILITLNDNDFIEFVHLKFTHTAVTRGAAFTTVTTVSTPIYVRDCIVDGCLTLFNSVGAATTIHVEACEIMNTTSATAAIICPTTLFVFGCEIHDNTGDGIRDTSGTTSTISARDSIIETNAIGINDVSTNTNVALTIQGCTIIDNTSDGVKIAAKAANTLTLELENNIIANNGGWGINQLDTQIETDASVRLNRNNAFGWPNTSGAYTGIRAGKGEITLTADPFTNRAGRNFSLNNTAGAGALLRALAFPTTFPSGTTLNYHDVGVVQHQDSGSGGGGSNLLVHPGMGGGMSG